MNGHARYRRIVRFAATRMVQAWWFELALPRLGLSALAARGRSRRMERLAHDFHVLAVSLGGLMIKVGQFMSSRLDVLPPEVTRELEGLQDEVPPVPFPELRAEAERSLGRSLDEAYAWFDARPLAAASIGQAHRARLHAADAAEAGFVDVVVKVQRPGIADIVDIDLRALRWVAARLDRVRVVRTHVDLPALLEEFALTCGEEIDYEHEARNAARFGEAFADDQRVAAPLVAWEHSSLRILTLQDVTAIKINDRDALVAAGISPGAVADVFAAVMFDQLFQHGFFHADPHPGNVFVLPVLDAPGGFVLTFVDFGMMGEVPEHLRASLSRLFIAVASRDGRAMVRLMGELGVLLPNADPDELERAVTAVFDRFGGMGFGELQKIDEREFRAFATQFNDLLRELPFQLPENYLLLIRAVSLTSGVCSALDPAFNVWDAVEPYAARLLQSESRGVLSDVARDATATLGRIARIPGRVDDVLDRVESGRLVANAPRVEARLRVLERLVRRGVAAVLFAGLVIAGALVLPTVAPLGIVLMSVSAVPLLYAVFARSR